MNIVRRKSDGAVFRASHPEDPETFARICGDAFAGGGFYFRRIRLQPKRWWRWRQRLWPFWRLWPSRWVETGEIWEPKSGEFNVASSSAQVKVWGMYEEASDGY